MRLLSILFTFLILGWLATLVVRPGAGGGVNSLEEAERRACQVNIQVITATVEGMGLQGDRENKTLKEISGAFLGQLPSCPKTQKMSYDFIQEKGRSRVFCLQHGFAGEVDPATEKAALRKGLNPKWRPR